MLRRRLGNFPRLPAPAKQLEDGDLRYELENDVSDEGMRRAFERVGRSISLKNADGEEATPTEESQSESEPQPEPARAEPTQRHPHECPFFAMILRRYFSSSISGCSSDPSATRVEQPLRQWNAMDLIFGREAGLGRTNKWTQSQKRGALCPSHIPSHVRRVVDHRGGHAYTSAFTDDGDLFIAGYQDQRIVVYRPDSNWEIVKRISARMLRWTITDTCLSHDGRFLLYSTISPVVHIVKIKGEDSVVDSQANITEIHAPLFVAEDDMFGIWSMAWSRDSQELIVGTNGDETNICLYNMQHQCTTDSVSGHTLDVNSVAFMDDSSQVFASGSDDSLIKIWDRRTLGQSASPRGTLVGHLEGITYIDAKGDGRYLLSNCKDQTIKLWDIRKLVSPDTASSHQRMKNETLPHFLWDYRWNEYPARGYLLEHPRDASLMTFRGHSVLQTLIRAYFSPQFTTGQRYIYTGCRNGTIRVFDILSGETVKELHEHRSVVRDCAWHPYEPFLVSTSWDGSILEWAHQSE